jgi:hypothetical protein
MQSESIRHVSKKKPRNEANNKKEMNDKKSITRKRQKSEGISVKRPEDKK